MGGEKDEKTEDAPTPKGQGRLPGMVPKKIARLVDKAEEVLDFQEKRMHYAEKEDKARDELKEIMKEEKLKEYRLDDEYHVVIESSEEKAFVRKIRTRKAPKAKKVDD